VLLLLALLLLGCSLLGLQQVCVFCIHLHLHTLALLPPRNSWPL
jgi:hypothetical protein